MAKFEDGCYGSLKGIALIAKVLAGRCRMHYTRVAAGKGRIPDDLTPKDLMEPPEYVMDAMISSVTNPVDGECQASVQINSAFVQEGFYCTWLILYAEDPDEGEVPFTALCLESEPEWIRPASSIVGKLAHFDIIAAVGDVDNVSATIDPDALVTLETVQQLISEHNEDPEAHAELFKQFIKAGENGKPGSPLILDDKGKIPETVLPDDIVRLGEDGKINRSVLPDEVFQRQDGVLTVTITIPSGAWEEDPDGPCAYRAEIACEDATEAHIPYVSLDGPSMAAAESCGMCDKAESANGVLRFWADTAPVENIIARAALFGPGGGTVAAVSTPIATADSPGTVKPGSGLEVASDGTLSVDVASDTEINEMLNRVFPSDNK